MNSVANEKDGGPLGAGTAPKRQSEDSDAEPPSKHLKSSCQPASPTVERCWSVLHKAAMAGDVEIVKSLLSANCSTRLQDRCGRTPLHIAVVYWKESVVEVLLNADSENDIQDQDGRTPLHVATERGYARIVDKLLSNGANAHLQDRWGQTPLHIALQCNRTQAAELLVNKGHTNDIQDVNLSTPLHLAALEGCLGMVEKLLSNGSRTHLQDRWGQTPLHIALECKRTQAAEVLVNKGHTNDIQDANLSTPLHLAALKGHLGIVEELLSNGARTHLKDRWGRTALHNALRSKRDDIGLVLVEVDGRNSIQDEDGKTPLHLVAEQKFVYKAQARYYANIARKLLFNDVHPHLMDNEGNYPIELAVTSGNSSISRMILKSLAWRNLAIHWDELKLDPITRATCFTELSELSAEVQKVKNVKFPKSTVSLYDVASRHVIKSALYFENKRIRRSFDCKWAWQFPNYAALIFAKLWKARMRRTLNKNSQRHFRDSLCWKLPDLPLTSIGIILLYLTDKDMQTFLDAFEFTSKK